MNCDNDFYIRYEKSFVKVKPFCESSHTHFKIYLQNREVKLQSFVDEFGNCRWYESGNQESELAKVLGQLIEEQQKETME